MQSLKVLIGTSLTRLLVSRQDSFTKPNTRLNFKAMVFIRLLLSNSTQRLTVRGETLALTCSHLLSQEIAPIFATHQTLPIEPLLCHRGNEAENRLNGAGKHTREANRPCIRSGVIFYGIFSVGTSIPYLLSSERFRP